MTTEFRTILPDNVRLQLAQMTTLGAGNFLEAALSQNPYPSDPLLFCEVPFQSLSGLRYSTLSLNDLDILADQYAAFYFAKGVRAHDPVAIYRGDGVDYLIHYLALTRIGAIGVLTNGNMPPDTAVIHFARVGIAALVVDRQHLEQLQALKMGFEELNLRLLICDEDATSDFSGEGLPVQAKFTHSPDDPIMIAHSSGTTGIPKAVLLQHEKFFYGIRYRLGMPAVKGGEKILSSLPHSHNCAIAYIMLALLSGTPVVITSDHSGENVLKHIAVHRPTMVVSFPQTYVEVTESNMRAYDLSSVSLWFNGGDAAHEVHIRMLIEHGVHHREGEVRKGSIFIDGMGSSEMGFSLFRHVHFPGSQRYNRCVGKPLDWVDAQVLGTDGELLPPHIVGRLGVKAPSVTSGYWNNSALTFQSRVRGYFLTGDLGYRDSEGFFYHVDRTSDMVATKLGPVYTLEAEEVLMRENPAVSDASIVAVAGLDDSKSATAFVRLRPEMAALPEDILATTNAALTQLGRNLIANVQIVGAQDIPLGTTGKVLKRLLREKYAQTKVPSSGSKERINYANL